MGNKRTEEEWGLREFPLESKLQAYVMQRLKGIEGGHFFKIADRFTSGISDIIGCHHGVFIAIELKVKNNEPTKLQEAFLDKIWLSGGVGGTAYNWRDVKNILRSAGVDI